MKHHLIVVMIVAARGGKVFVESADKTEKTELVVL